MQLKLKDRKRLFKKLILNKEKKENILFIGTIGSGYEECIFSLFDIMKKENVINKRSIFIDSLDFLFNISKWYSIIQNNHQEKITDNNFCFFIANEEKEYYDFIKKDFKEESTKNKLYNKNICFHLPYLGKCQVKLRQNFNVKVLNFLNNLPENHEKEIPIFINNIGFLKQTDFKRYEEVVTELNNKGYFLIAGIEDYDYDNPEATLKYIKNNFKHIFLFKTELSKNEATYFFDDMFTGSQIRNLNCGEYFYLKNFNKENNKPLYFPYKDVKIAKEINLKT